MGLIGMYLLGFLLLNIIVQFLYAVNPALGGVGYMAGLGLLAALPYLQRRLALRRQPGRQAPYQSAAAGSPGSGPDRRNAIDAEYTEHEVK